MKVLFSFLLLTLTSVGQDAPPLMQQRLEERAAAEEGEAEDDLSLFLKQPLDLNSAGEEELEELGLLTPLQIHAFLKYRKLLGKLIDLHELQAVPGWDLGTIRQSLPYLTLSAAESPLENLRQRLGGDHLLLLRMTQGTMSDAGRDDYAGSSSRIVFRYRYQFRSHLYFGLTGDKDAGEPFPVVRPLPGFDFYSVHVFVRGLGKIRSLAIGDYCLNLGQGLLCWQSFGSGKGGGVLDIKKQAPVLMPYRSTGEYYFNRGAAITLGSKKSEFTVFFSSKKTGATMNDSLDGFTAIHTSGYHRTQKEIQDRDRLHQLRLGGNLIYHWSGGQGGVNILFDRFSHKWLGREEPYQYFLFAGKQNLLYSLDLAHTYRNLHFFAEGAADTRRNGAVIGGLILSADPRLDLSVLYRNCSRSFPSLSGRAFTENSLPVNEKGFYAGVSLRPVSRWQVDGFADLFRFPWLRYRVNGPSGGSEYGLTLRYLPGKEGEVYLRYRSQTKAVNRQEEGPLAAPRDEVRKSLRLHLSRSFGKSFSWQSRMEALNFSRPPSISEQGFLAYTEGRVVFSRLSALLRLQYFETGSYDSRLYAFEPDVLYSSSVPLFIGKGFRYYLLVKVEGGEKTTGWVKWAQTIPAAGGKEKGKKEITCQVIFRL